MNRSTVINATKWLAISEIIAKVISPITTIILARLLSQEVFGIVASITAITSLADLLTDAGFNAYIIQHQFEDEKEKNNVFNVCFWSNLSISIFLYLIIFFQRDLFAKLVGASGYGNVLIISCLVLPFTSISSIEHAIMKKEMMFKKTGIIKIVSKLVPFVITIPLAMMGLEYWSLIWATLFGEVVNVILSLKLCGFIPKPYYNFSDLRKITSFSAWAFLESICEWLLSNVSLLSLGTIFGLYYLGVFKAGINIITQISTSVYALYANVYKSAISKAQNDQQTFTKLFNAFQKVSSAISIPLGVGAFFYRELLTYLLLGNKWTDAIPLVGWWGLCSLFSIAFGNFYSDGIRAKGYPKKLVFIDVTYLISIIILLAFSKNLSFTIFVKLFCLLKLIQPILQILVGRKICNVPFKTVLLSDIPQLIGTFSMCLLIIGLNLNHLELKAQLVSVFFCVFVYFLVYYIAFPNKTELIGIIKTYGRKIGKRK